MLLIGCAARAADLLWLCGARLLRLLLLRVICTAAANPAQQTDETVSDGRRAKVVAVGYTHRVCGRFSEERCQLLELDCVGQRSFSDWSLELVLGLGWH